MNDENKTDSNDLNEQLETVEAEAVESNEAETLVSEDDQAEGQ